ncbi:MAG: choice-of-anchor tandem repeat GloVer-containing protein, partial [Terriglobales bacterium]
MTRLHGGKWACAVFLFCATAASSPAQTFTTLADFEGRTNGDNPYYMSLVLGSDGNLFGTTFDGGLYNGGEVFRITLGGTLTALKNFCNPREGNCPNGGSPYA